MAEKGVGIVKNLLTKATESGNDPYLALVSYRSSPLACGYSPDELLMGRKLRNRIPRLSDHINVVVVLLMQNFKITLVAIIIKVLRSLNP